MTRVVKDSEERKNDFLDTAEKLFMEKGYDNTSINDIVNELDVAHGLFYYYFDSKKDIVRNIADRMYSDIQQNFVEILSNTELNAQEKLLKFIDRSADIKTGREYMVGILGGEENLLLYHNILKKIVEKMIPLFTELVKEGVEEGVFDTEYPEEASKFIFYSRFRIGIEGEPLDDIKKLKKESIASADMMERVLGAEKESITSLFEEKWKYFEDRLYDMKKEAEDG